MSEKNPDFDDVASIAAKKAARELVEKAAQHVAKKAASRAVSKGATALVKGAANPAFIVGDVLELGVEKATGSRNAGRAASAGVYIGTGAALGGPAGAVVAGGMWAVGQLIGTLFD